jgi:hypothetical protein
MTYYPQSTAGLSYTTGTAGPTAAPATITAAGSNNTKGSYTQLISSLGFTCNFINLVMTRATAATRSFLIDIATGAGGAEVVKIPNMLFGINNASTSHDGARTNIPFAVTSGTRIAARCQCDAASSSCFGVITPFAAGSTPAPSSYTTGGVSTGTSHGTTVDPGGSANTKGSYAQVVSSTSLVIQILVIMIAQSATVTSQVATQWALDVATGAGGAEVVLIPDLRNGSAGLSNAARVSIPWYEFLTYIASSTRIACRASADDTTANSRELTLGVSGATGPAETSGGMRSYVG